MLFKDRQEAGRLLAEALLPYKDRRPVVLALPRGGVPIGFEVAMALDATLDLMLVRKIGHPRSREFAIGAVAGCDAPEVFIDEAAAGLDVPQAYIDAEIERQSEEMRRQRDLYLKDRAPLDLRGHSVIIVDDGVATGATMLAALRKLRKQSPAELVVAVPVASPRVLAALRQEAEAVVCLAAPEDFFAVGSFYADFRAVEDGAVVNLLVRAAAARTGECHAG